MITKMKQRILKVVNSMEQKWIDEHFDSLPNIISYFSCTNNIFVDFIGAANTQIVLTTFFP